MPAPGPALLAEPDVQGSHSSLILHCLTQSADMDTSATAQLQDPPPDADAACSGGRRRKRLRSSGTATPVRADEQQPQLQSNKRKQPPLAQQAVRQSIRQRGASRAIETSDPAAVAGYVQQSALGPEMQSGLPFDTG